MEGTKKEIIIAGVVGGITSLLLAGLARRFIWGRGRKGGWQKRGGPGEAKLLKMQSDKMPAAVGPYCFGKMIQMPNGSLYAWSSGQLGLDPVT